MLINRVLDSDTVEDIISHMSKKINTFLKKSYKFRKDYDFV